MSRATARASKFDSAQRHLKSIPATGPRSNIAVTRGHLETLRGKTHVISALRKRGFAQQYGVGPKRLAFPCCAFRLQNQFEWRQVYATGFRVGFGRDSARPSRDNARQGSL